MAVIRQRAAVSVRLTTFEVDRHRRCDALRAVFRDGDASFIVKRAYKFFGFRRRHQPAPRLKFTYLRSQLRHHACRRGIKAIVQFQHAAFSRELRDSLLRIRDKRRKMLRPLAAG